MTKTLTEQWREGTLEQRYYYVKYFGNGQKPFVEIELKNFLLDLVKVKDRDKIEVLAPVPNYDEYKEITRKVENLEWDKKEDDALINFCNKRLVKYHKEIAKLKEQIEEANAIIDLYFPKDKKINAVCVKPINDYREKWGVK